MGYFLVSYTVIDSRDGSAMGAGAIDWTMSPPTSINDVSQLSDQITESQQQRNRLPRNQWVSVTGWSEMRL
ncbi:hypothetical protein [Actinoplanes rectilineatus]|uniref:hypothetical protein n=1 Tax=Actinoplanes rectilineatus TaxID=113571 RepID=UPI000A64749E|nr:hypothetical protein [Actinoplanes rectilineatus]